MTTNPSDRAPEVSDSERYADGYPPADWLIGIGIALCAAGMIGTCAWWTIGALT